MTEFLATQPLMLLFVTIGLGYLLSHIQIKGVSLGIAAVLFVGLGLGAWGGGQFALPELVGKLGLLMFVYTIGLQAGPSFFRVFRRQGLQITLLAVAAVGAAAALSWLLARWLHLDPIVAVGLFCGGTTNTPALAVVSESLHGTPEAVLPAVGYSVAYPMAVLLPILLAQLALVMRHSNVQQEALKAEQNTGESHSHPASINLVIESPSLDGLAIRDSLFAKQGLIISRVQRGEDILVGTGSVVLHQGDILHVVGEQTALQTLSDLVGREIRAAGPESDRTQVDFRRIVLTNPALVGKHLSDLQLESEWGALVTRLRRGDVDFVPADQTVLERGDRLRIVAPLEKIPALSKYLGDSLRSLTETDFASLSLGVLLGLLLGELVIPLNSQISFKLGTAGGPLVMALLLGWLGRTGPVIWSLPMEVNFTFRQLGLVLFFAAVGLRSGGAFIQALQQQGLLLIGVGSLITAVSTLILLVGSLWLFKWDWVTATGILAGGQTQPAILAFVDKMAKSEAPNTAYVSIMPAAMLLKIILAQLLLWWALSG